MARSPNDPADASSEPWAPVTPAAAPSDDPPWQTSEPGRAAVARGLAVVVVDRDRDGLALRDLLRLHGFRTRVCVGGTEAVRTVQQEEPALLILDCWSDPVDPFAVLGFVRTRPELARGCLVVRAPSLRPDSDPLVRTQGAAAVLDRDGVLDDLADWIAPPRTRPSALASFPPGHLVAPRDPGRAPFDRERDQGGHLGPGANIADRFVLERRLGAGGAAEVYLARDTELVQHVALKVLREASLGRVGAMRFRREVRVCRELQHPNIVRLYEFGSWRGLLYLTMEYVPGRTVRDLIERSPGGLPVSDVLSLARQATAGLVAVHSTGVAHRDIKPANLMILPSGVLKIMDFGLARGTPTGLDVSDDRLVVGTPHYLAPERLRGAPEPCLSGDVWSLGAVLYEALCGQPPFDAPDVGTLMKQIVRGDPVPLRSRRPEVPARVAHLVTSLLETDPAKRPADLAAVARQFGELHRSGEFRA